MVNDCEFKEIPSFKVHYLEADRKRVTLFEMLFGDTVNTSTTWCCGGPFYQSRSVVE